MARLENDQGGAVYFNPITKHGKNVDFPNDDDWVKIQIYFMLNEMPVTDTSKKVKSVIKRRQQDGKWICAAPYGYIVNKKQEFEIVPTEAEIVRRIFQLYRCGEYHKRGLKACTSHHIRVDKLDELLKIYIQKVKDNSAAMLDRLNADLEKKQRTWRRPRSRRKIWRRCWRTSRRN